MKRPRKLLKNILKKIGNLSSFTDFEKKVYKALLTIKKGEIKSYEWLAKRIGNPKAARAVGNALNKNPFPGIIPCHRIIRKDGSIGGFAKGTALKKKLLAREGLRL